MTSQLHDYNDYDQEQARRDWENESADRQVDNIEYMADWLSEKGIKVEGLSARKIKELYNNY